VGTVLSLLSQALGVSLPTGAIRAPIISVAPPPPSPDWRGAVAALRSLGLHKGTICMLSPAPVRRNLIPFVRLFSAVSTLIRCPERAGRGRIRAHPGRGPISSLLFVLLRRCFARLTMSCPAIICEAVGRSETRLDELLPAVVRLLLTAGPRDPANPDAAPLPVFVDTRQGVPVVATKEMLRLIGQRRGGVE